MENWDWNENPDDLFDAEYDDENEEKRIRTPIWFRLIAAVLLLSFLFLAFPMIKVLYTDIVTIPVNEELNHEPLIVDKRSAVVSVEGQVTNGISRSAKSGTGFCIGEQGPIITNFHVVDGLDGIKVSFGNGQTYFSNDIQEINGADLAVVSIAGNNLPSLSVDYDAIVSKGDKVMVIGNPLGSDRVAFEGTVGQFHLRPDDGRVFDISVLAKPGSSGSPVLNQNGKVIGVVYASTRSEINGQVEECALAIPVSRLENQLNQ